MAAIPAHSPPLALPSTGLPHVGGATGPSVLVVEDDRDIRDCIADALDMEGYTVAVCPHGRDALEKLRGGFLPDVILLDLLMPVMSGWEFRQEQLADPLLSRIPVVVVSASTPGTARPDRHLPKPFGIEELLAIVSELTSRA